jgi:hypothetical protein
MCLEASRVFIESVDTQLKVKQNEFLAAEGLTDLDDSNYDWKPYFHGVPSTKTVRAGEHFTSF